jgi:small-conductance mechanosensitive channel
MAIIVRGKIRSIRLLTAVVVLAAVAALAAATVVAAIYVPQIAVWVPIITLGLALALQKYTASFLAYFAITFSGIYSIGDRR